MLGLLKKENVSNKKQKYIVFEGILCCGKSTQLTLSSQYLLDEGYKIQSFEEAGEGIRPIFRLNERDDYIDGLVFTADTLFQNKKIKAVPEDTIILAERSFISTLVYQSELEIGLIYKLHRIDVGFYLTRPVLVSDYFRFPDVVILLDVTPNEAIRRAKDIGRKKEKWDNIHNLEVVRQRYINQGFKNDFLFPFIKINEKSIDDTWIDVKKIIDDVIKPDSYLLSDINIFLKTYGK